MINMLETIGIVVLTIATAWWFIAITSIGTLFFVHNESEGWSIFFALMLCFGLFHITGVSSLFVLLGLLAYIPLGLIWSLYRWKRYCSDSCKEDKLKNLNTVTKNQLLRDIDPSHNIGIIVYWIFIWPFSLLDNILGDLVDMVETFVREYIIGIYDKISKQYINKINGS